MSERVVVECPNCFAKLALADETKLGRKLRCKKCSEVFVAESSMESVPQQAPVGTKRGVSNRGKKHKSVKKQPFPMMLVGAGGLVLLIVLGAGIWMFRDPAMPQPVVQVAANDRAAVTSQPASGVSPNGTASPSSIDSTASKVELETKLVLEDQVTLQIPRDFTVMNEELLQAKYPTAQRPSLVFTDSSGAVNIAFSHTLSPVTPTQLPAVVPQLEAQFRRLVPATDWIQTNALTIAGVKWFSFEFRSQAVDMRIRNLMVLTSLNNRLLLVTFNAPAADEGIWMPVANTIVQSLRLSQKSSNSSRPDFGLPPEFTTGLHNPTAPPAKPLPAAALGQGTVTIKITNLIDNDQGQLMADQISQATKATSTQVVSSNNQLTITVNGVGNLKVLAQALEMGEVTEVDEVARTISIRANPSRVAASNNSPSINSEPIFEITVSPKLKVVPLLTGPESLFCSKDGKVSLEKTIGPTFVVGISRKAFENEARQQAIEEIIAANTKGSNANSNKVTKKTIQLGRLEGIETQIETENAKSGSKTASISVILFDSDKTIFLTGTADVNEYKEYLPEFQAMIQSFKLKPR